MVYLDVVYNHFGPQLNYLHSYAENFFTKRHATGWGPAVNLEGRDGAFVREFLIESALMWLRDYGFDGLRLDAVHALKDASDRSFPRRACRDRPQSTSRPAHTSDAGERGKSGAPPQSLAGAGPALRGAMGGRFPQSLSTSC